MSGAPPVTNTNMNDLANRMARQWSFKNKNNASAAKAAVNKAKMNMNAIMNGLSANFAKLSVKNNKAQGGRRRKTHRRKTSRRKTHRRKTHHRRR